MYHFWYIGIGKKQNWLFNQIVFRKFLLKKQRKVAWCQLRVVKSKRKVVNCQLRADEQGVDKQKRWHKCTTLLLL